MAVPRLLVRMLIPAGTSLRKTEEKKDTGERRKREDPQGFLLTGFLQDGCLMGQDGAECQWPAVGAAVSPSKGVQLLGLVEGFHSLFILFSQLILLKRGGGKQQVAPGGFLAQHP